MALRSGSTSVEELRELPLFEEIPTEVLVWLVQVGRVEEADPGDTIVEPQSPADRMIVLLNGDIRVRVSMQGQPTRIYSFTRGAATGLLPYSRMTIFPARVTCVTPVRGLYIGREHFPEMLTRSPELGQRLVSAMLDRSRTGEKEQQQREKMLALGKLAAGLAHELNNPSAAIMRAADNLRTRLGALTPLAAKLAACGLSAAHMGAADTLRQLALKRSGAVHLTPLERGECEEAVAEWLETHGVPQPWMLAETYVDVGLCEEDLTTWAESLPKECIGDVLAWVEASLGADRLLEEIGDAGCRISELVAAVKAYSHMDRAIDKQPTDVRQGIENTIRMLTHELKKHKVTVDKDFDKDLPPVSGYPGELNQVWTNLLDNAIDAVPEGGKVRVEARQDDGAVTVRVIDNGKGIAPDIQSRIFEPFFTTKPVGEGTGLGLDIVQRIITQQHGGQVGVESKPGETIFTVTLPL